MCKTNLSVQQLQMQKYLMNYFNPLFLVICIVVACFRYPASNEPHFILYFCASRRVFFPNSLTVAVCAFADICDRVIATCLFGQTLGLLRQKPKEMTFSISLRNNQFKSPCKLAMLVEM